MVHPVVKRRLIRPLDQDVAILPVDPFGLVDQISEQLLFWKAAARGGAAHLPAGLTNPGRSNLNPPDRLRKTPPWPSPQRSGTSTSLTPSSRSPSAGASPTPPPSCGRGPR